MLADAARSACALALLSVIVPRGPAACVEAGRTVATTGADLRIAEARGPNDAALISAHKSTLKSGKDMVAIKVDIFMMRLQRLMKLRQFAIAPLGNRECTIVAALDSLSTRRERRGSGNVNPA
jgi:hypothetical protein